ncbi:MAG: hypothetical protein N838_17420 [Thiohalocapsa sp. PB-PSB1]|jgi:hypothetical protein|nr:MAG: hypothetical protein N838_17420 [Thiohalocapsa sp. PB-PSB1]
MPTDYVSLLSGFVGAVLGAAASLGGVYLQQRTQQKRDRARFALDAAVAEFRAAEEHARFMAAQGQPVVCRDLAYFVFLHSSLSERLFAGKKVNRKQWEQIHLFAKDVSEAGNAVYTKPATSSD